MIPSRMMTASVVVERHPAAPVPVRDRYNRPVESAPQARSRETVSAYFRPRRSNTVIDGGENIEAEMQVIFQPNLETRDIAAVWVDGLRYEPDGQAQPHWHPISQKVMYRSLWLRKGTAQMADQGFNLPVAHRATGDTWADEPSAWRDLSPVNAWSM